MILLQRLEAALLVNFRITSKPTSKSYSDTVFCLGQGGECPWKDIDYDLSLGSPIVLYSPGKIYKLGREFRKKVSWGLDEICTLYTSSCFSWHKGHVADRTRCFSAYILKLFRFYLWRESLPLCTGADKGPTNFSNTDPSSGKAISSAPSSFGKGSATLSSGTSGPRQRQEESVRRLFFYTYTSFDSFGDGLNFTRPKSYFDMYMSYGWGSVSQGRVNRQWISRCQGHSLTEIDP